MCITKVIEMAMGAVINGAVWCARRTDGARDKATVTRLKSVTEDEGCHPLSPPKGAIALGTGALVVDYFHRVLR